MMRIHPFSLLNFLPEIYLCLVWLVMGLLRTLKSYHPFVIGVRVWGFWSVLGGLGALVGILYGPSFGGGASLWNDHGFTCFSCIIMILIGAVSWISLVKSAEKNPKKIIDLGWGVSGFLMGALLAISSGDFIQLGAGVGVQFASMFALLYIVSPSRLEGARGYGRVMLSAGIFLLLGIFFLCLTTQSCSFQEMALHMRKGIHFGLSGPQEVVPIYFVVGSFLVLISIMIPLGIFPFHTWVRSFYDALDSHVFLFIILSMPVLFLFLLAKMLWGPFTGYMLITPNGLCKMAETFFMALGGLTVLVGVLGVFTENKINVFIAYSSLIFVGYCVIGFSLRSYAGVEAAFLLIILFVLIVLGLCSVLQAINIGVGRGFQRVCDFRELQGLHAHHPFLSIGIGLLVLSLGCVPPLSGFWAWVYLLFACLERDLWPGMVFIGIMGAMTVFSSLRVLRYIYRDKPLCLHGASLEMSTIIFMMLAIVGGIAYNAYSDLYKEGIYLLTDSLLVGRGG